MFIKKIQDKYFIAKLLVACFIICNVVCCKKDYTCRCSSTNGVTTASGDTTIHNTKRKAKQACENGNATVTSGTNTSVTSCTFS